MAKLAAEKEATLRLKGENGIMKKKFSRLSKSVSCSLQVPLRADFHLYQEGKVVWC